MTNTVERPGHPIPGMRIIFQQPLSPIEGHGISFELAEDVTLAEADLNELLDRVTGASRRLCYIEELPRLRQLLAMKRQALAREREELARAIARMQSNVVAMSRNRREQRPPAIQDQNSVTEFEKRIAQTTQEVLLAERRIPYLEAYIAGDKTAVEPIDSDEPMAEAAE